MSKRRMDAYYYGFEATGSEAIDKILGAVACAGKAYHHTQDWEDEASPYDDHIGKTPAEWIQNAAIEAAAEIERLRAENARLREALQEANRGLEIALCWSDNDKTWVAHEAVVKSSKAARAALAEQEK